MKNKRSQELAGIITEANFGVNKKQAMTTLAFLTKMLKGNPSRFELKKAADNMPSLQGAFNAMSRSVDDK